MPLPKAYEGVLASATAPIISAGTHAIAQLVLHLTGAQRLSREEKRRYQDVLKEILTVLREEEETKP